MMRNTQKLSNKADRAAVFENENGGFGIFGSKRSKQSRAHAEVRQHAVTAAAA